LSSRRLIRAENRVKMTEYNFICTMTNKIVMARDRILVPWIGHSDWRSFATICHPALKNEIVWPGNATHHRAGAPRRLLT
jgi:hypothetical protein